MKIALIDLETLGLDPQVHDIIEIGCLIIDSETFDILDQFEAKVKPTRLKDASAKALEVNGYSDEEWKFAMSLKESLEFLGEKVKGLPMMSYNVSFDRKFMEAAYKSEGIEYPFHYHHFDLLTLAWGKIPHSKMQSWALKTVCAYLRVPPEPAVHRAMNGTLAAYKVYLKLMS